MQLAAYVCSAAQRHFHSRVGSQPLANQKQKFKNNRSRRTKLMKLGWRGGGRSN